MPFHFFPLCCLGDGDPGLECSESSQRRLCPLGQRGQEPLPSRLRGHGEKHTHARLTKWQLFSGRGPLRESPAAGMCAACFCSGSWKPHLHYKGNLLPLFVLWGNDRMDSWLKGKEGRDGRLEKAWRFHLTCLLIGWEWLCWVWISTYRTTEWGAASSFVIQIGMFGPFVEPLFKKSIERWSKSYITTL